MGWVGRACWAAVAIALGGCAADRGMAPGDAGRDGAGGDAGSIDAGSIDAGPADAGPPSCEELATAGAPFEIAPELGTTQIHASLAFDGEASWLAFNLPEEGDTGLFDVFAMRIGCDGRVVTPAFLVNTTTAPNDVDPSVAISGEQVLIAWHSDDSTLEHNLDIRYRIFGLDGTPVLADDRVLETTRGGTPVVGNALAPHAIARAGGGFWVAGMRGIDAAPGFQIFVQAIAADGTLDGEAIIDERVRLGEGRRIDHSPVVALAPLGGVIAWYRNVRGLDNDLVVATIDDASGTPTVSEPRLVSEALPAAPYGIALARVAPSAWLFVWSSGDSPDLRLYARLVAGP